jgi:peptidoglycan/LPS O-acetylase OafA/YrhL
MDRTARTTQAQNRATRTRPSGGRRVVRKIGFLMAFETASLAVAATLRLSGQVHGHAKPFDADHAGVAEAIIAVALGGGALALLRASAHARVIALTTTGFAIVGFVVGLTMTAQGGDLPDTAYHLTVLPMLILSLMAFSRTDESAFRPVDQRPDNQTPSAAISHRIGEA